MVWYLRCPECRYEFVAPPHRPATLDYHERCPRCGRVFYAKRNRVWREGG